MDLSVGSGCSDAVAVNLQPYPQAIKKIIRDRLRVAWYKIQNNLIFFSLNFFLHQNNICCAKLSQPGKPYQLKIKFSYLQQQEKEKKNPNKIKSNL